MPDLLVVTDVCLCEYTDHGHCGVLNHENSLLPDGYVLNDETLDVLARVSVSHARAGADVVAPSGMIDGMVASIREGLDGCGYDHVPIMSYAIKYASAFYGPFRDAAQGAPEFGDRRTHQMDPGNVREALKEAALDVEEGADFLMVKPALPYLDVIRRVHDAHPELPMVAYNVSGEYSMVKAAGERGWLDERAVALENLTAIKRAGADLVITYHALDAAGMARGLEAPGRPAAGSTAATGCLGKRRHSSPDGGEAGRSRLPARLPRPSPGNRSWKVQGGTTKANFFPGAATGLVEACR